MSIMVLPQIATKVVAAVAQEVASLGDIRYILCTTCQAFIATTLRDASPVSLAQEERNSYE